MNNDHDSKYALHDQIVGLTSPLNMCVFIRTSYSLLELNILQPNYGRSPRLEDLWRNEEFGRAEIQSHYDGSTSSESNTRTG